MKRHKKPMTIVVVLVAVIVAMVFAGCKFLCPQPLDKGMEWAEEDGHNKEAILDGHNGTSTNAFTGEQELKK